MGIMLTVLIVGIMFLWVPIASYLDVRLFKNPKTRGRTVRKDRPMNTDSEIFDAFVEVNLFEIGLFIAGVVVGFIAGLF